jgi:beta-aspartyl-peptidase (threonine type)
MFRYRLILAAAGLALLASPAAAQDAPRWSFAIDGGAAAGRDALA